MNILSKIIVTVSLSIASFFGYHTPSPVIQTPITLGDYNPTGGLTYRLQSSINSTANTLTLTSFKEPISNIKYTMSYLNSSVEYATINPQGSTKEFVSFTGITQNSDNTATLTGVVRGLGFSYPYTASSTLRSSHSGQEIFILSNPPQLYQQFYNLNNVSTSTNILVFSSTTPPRLDSVAAQAGGTYIATTSEFATVAYANSISTAGAPNATAVVKGIIELATAAEAQAGTATGGTAASLVPPNSLFNQTQSATTIIPVTNSSGKLAQGFLDLTQLFNFIGAINASSTSNFIASSTQFTANISNLIATSSFKFINGLSGMASSSVLLADTTGNFTYGSPQWSYVNTSTGNISGTASSTVFRTTTIPGNSLGTTGYIEFTLPVSNANTQSNNTTIFEVAYGNATSTFAIPWTAGTGGKSGTLKITIVANGATNSQKITFSSMLVLTGNVTTTETQTFVSTKTIATDSTANQVIMVVGRANGGETYTTDLVTGKLNR